MGGVFFDPENDQSIAKALRRLIDSSDLRRQVAARGRALANDFSWKRCANETFAFVAETHRKCTT
jgi:glycosyltransferase involved in cell wall biosynthesis